jgi:hypothetical protein
MKRTLSVVSLFALGALLMGAAVGSAGTWVFKTRADQTTVNTKIAEFVEGATGTTVASVDIEGDIAGKWARGVVDKNPEAVADARRQLAEWNADNPGQPIRITLPQILQRVKKLRQDRESRFISTVSRERRAAVAEAMQ